MTVPGLNEFEQAVLDKLLAGGAPLLIALREQASQATVSSRQYTGAGFYCSFELAPDVVPLKTPYECEIGDVDASIDGLEHGAGFLVFVREGRLSMLEGYSYGEPWPAEIKNFRLRYRREPRELPA